MGEMCLFFFNDTATTEIYTLSLHDALPIFYAADGRRHVRAFGDNVDAVAQHVGGVFVIDLVLRRARKRAVSLVIPERVVIEDRKSTRLNSSHANISYAVFCLKKKKHNGNFD